MLMWAVSARDGPVAIRYPRGGNGEYTDNSWDVGKSISDNGLCIHRSGEKIAIVTYGTLVNQAMKAADILSGMGVECAVIRLTAVAPLPVAQLSEQLDGCQYAFIIEETAGNCGIGDSLANALADTCPGLKTFGRDLGKRYIQHGAVDKLYDYYGLSGQKIADFVMGVFRDEN